MDITVLRTLFSISSLITTNIYDATHLCLITYKFNCLKNRFDFQDSLFLDIYKPQLILKLSFRLLYVFGIAVVRNKDFGAAVFAVFNF